MHFNEIPFVEFYGDEAKNGNECSGRRFTVFFVLSAAHLDRGSRATWMPPKDVPRTIAAWLQVHRVRMHVRCNPSREIIVGVGLQHDCTDGATSFAWWLRFLIPLLKGKAS